MITRKFLKTLNFRQFDEHDFEGFAGVDSPVPFIAETEDYLVIVDGDICEVFNIEDLSVAARCNSISNLPFSV
jgi:hypothetical protein